MKMKISPTETHSALRATHSAFKIRGFTLIELLVVISIIAVLAAFTIPVIGAINRQKYRSAAKAQLQSLETAIENYKSTYGFYPPDNPNNPLVNQLYYELSGMTSPASGTFRTLDGLETFTSANLNTAFGVGAIMNCSRGTGGEDSRAARNFLTSLNSNSKQSYTTSGVTVTLLASSVGGPDAGYAPLIGTAANPWRYRSSGTLTNNPGSYELWIQLSISGKTNCICNWNSKEQINNGLP